MSKETDTNLFKYFNKQCIKDNLSIDNCKECQDLVTSDFGLTCANPNPNTDTCNLLVIHFNL